MGLTVKNYAVAKELNQGEAILEMDFGGGQTFAFGLAIYNGQTYGTKKIVWENAAMLAIVPLDTEPKLVGLDFFNQYKNLMIQAKPEFANSYFAVIEAQTTPGGTPSVEVFADAGLSSTAAIGYFTDGNGTISEAAPVELTWDQKLAKAATLNSKSATASTSISDYLKKPVTYIVAGLVILAGWLLLGRKKENKNIIVDILGFTQF